MSKMDKYMERNISSSRGGIGFCGLLTIMLVAFKILGYIDWGWIHVLLPMILSAFGIFFLIVLSSILATIFRE